MSHLDRGMKEEEKQKKKKKDKKDSKSDTGSSDKKSEKKRGSKKDGEETPRGKKDSKKKDDKRITLEDEPTEKDKRSKKKKSKTPRKGDDEEGLTGIREDLMDIGKRKLAARPAEDASKGTKKAANQYTVKNKYFRVKVTDIVDPVTGEIQTSASHVVAIDYQLSNMLYSFQCLQKGYEKVSGFLGMVTQYPIFYGPSIVQKTQAIRTGTYAGPWMDAFMEWLEAEYKATVERIEALLRDGKIGFDGVWYLFEVGNRFYADNGAGLIVGSAVKTATYVEAMCGSLFFLTGEVVKSDGNQFFIGTENFQVGSFSGVVDIDKLSVKPMTKAVLDILSERGKAFQKVALGHHYLQYSKFLHFRHKFGIHYIKGDGRVMVDIATFNRLHPEYGRFEQSEAATSMQNLAAMYGDEYYDEYDDGSSNASAAKKESNGGASKLKLGEDMLYKTWPTVAGFSFAAKAWGEIIVTNLSPIVFNDDAYDKLVLAEEKKKMIKALVQDNEASQRDPSATFTDLITGKGGGIIFLLHGPPGSGKTLTAEAIAELLHRPLYSISVGELGTTAEQLETKLGLVLEVASIWNAVVLIDEADIFLEKRRKHDIVRNAMVGIFLRKLEYHQGVLFLTTNRVQVFDPAFNSRVSVAIKYHDLDENTRKIVWQNLLEAAKDANPAEKASALHMYSLNGRQIRTTIRLGLAIARSKAAELNIDMLRTTIEISSHFAKELELDVDEDADN